MRFTKRLFIAPLALLILFLGSVTVARADAIAFTGSRDTIDGPPASDPARCGVFPPNVFVVLPTGTNTSNLGPLLGSSGSFTSADSNCVNSATGNIFDGQFAWDFGGGNTFFGTYLGTIEVPFPPPGTPGDRAFTETFTLTGGTGLFAGASGTLLATGVVLFNAGGPDTHTTFTGTINVVPEPTTMLLLGTGLLGVAAKVGRRRRALKE